MNSIEEKAVSFRSGRDTLFGIVHDTAQSEDTGIVILVGGPQYRVGSHRMFVQIARKLASCGYPVLRFDFAGMGESDGSFSGFESVDRDIAAAIDHFAEINPSLRRIVVLGLCDGATAAAFYAHTDGRVAAIVLLNPWVHTEKGEAKTYLWHYYPRRLLQLDFWNGLVRGRVSITASVVDFAKKVRRVAHRRQNAQAAEGDFVSRMRHALDRFEGRILIVASENDFTASEFIDVYSTDQRWQEVRRAAKLMRLDKADHTLSSTRNMKGFCDIVCEWLYELSAGKNSNGG